MTWSSPVLPKLQDPNETPFSSLPSSEETSWISSIMLLGASVGTFIFGLVTSHLGRRPAILAMGPLLVVSYLAMAFIESLPSYYVCRFLIGLVSGGSLSIGMVYLGEQTTKSNRAAFFAVATVAVNCGALFTYSVGPYVKVKIFNMIWSIFAICFLVLFLIFGKETAHYFMSKGKEEQAREALSEVRSKTHDLDEELAEIKNKIREQGEGSLLDLLQKKPVVKAFYICVGIITLQQFSGINMILFYNQTMFEMSGSNLDAKICSILTGVAQVVGSLIAIYTAERFNRKNLLIASCAGMIVGFLPLGTYCYLRDRHTTLDSLSFLPLLCLIIATLGFGIGVAPVPMTIVSEIFPARIKELGTSVASSVLFIWAFFLTKYFDDMTQAMGIGESFYLYSGCLLMLIVFVVVFVVETKGKTLEEIQDHL